MIRAGSARQVINNELGTEIQGVHNNHTVQYIRDDLEANALWLESDGTGILFITVDLGILLLDYVERILPDIAGAAGIPRENIMIGCSHTHAAPSILETHPNKPIDEPYLERLRTWLCEIAKQAVSSAEQVRIAWGKGEAEIGYNRRVCYADGTHQMHGDPNRADATGLEGKSDPSQVALFVQDMEGKLKAVLQHNTAHPINYYGRDFLSADFPGLSRKFLRETLGDIEVLYFNGAQGDISVFDEYWKDVTPETAEQREARAAHLMTGETLRLLQHADYKDEVDIGHAQMHYDVKLRPMSDEHLAWAKETMDAHEIQPGEKSWDLDLLNAYTALVYHEQFGGHETETIELHAGHVDGLAFVTSPCEMFTHFALQVKRRSPFPATAFFGLTSGSMGYCPTMEGVLGGHHEGIVKLASRWDVTAGYLITDELARMLYTLHRESGR